MDYYQMPMFNKLLVSHIQKAAKWYEKTLGFNSVFKFRNDKNEVLMEHLRLEKYQDIMLISSDNFEVGNATYLNILVKDINNLEKHISSQFIVEQLEEKPWNDKEITIKYLDGHLLTLTHSNITDKDFKKLIKKTSKDF